MWSLAIAATSSLSGCNRDKNGPLRYERLDHGLDYALVTTLSETSNARATLHVVRFDPARWQQRVVTEKQTGAKLADAASFRKAAVAAPQDEAVAAINAGFFDPQNRPLGLLVSEGKQVARLRKVDHGVFTVGKDGPQLQHARKFKMPEALDFAVECGPRLVVDGKPLTFKPGVALRTAIGFDVAGQVFWIVSTGAMSLTDLAAFLVRPAASGGLGLNYALNLDGGKSTMFDLHTAKIKASVRTSLQIPVGIALVRRRPVVRASSRLSPQSATGPSQQKRRGKTN